MADKKAEQQAKDKAKRTMLTPAEKIAKLEAQLKDAREKAHDKDRKVVADLTVKRDALVKKISDEQAKLAVIDADIAAAQGRIAGPVTDGVGETPEGTES